MGSLAGKEGLPNLAAGFDRLFTRVDDAIENALQTVVGRGAIAAATAAEKEAGQRRDQLREALGRDLEAPRRRPTSTRCHFSLFFSRGAGFLS
jgi:hypothetical protein